MNHRDCKLYLTSHIQGRTQCFRNWIYYVIRLKGAILLCVSVVSDWIILSQWTSYPHYRICILSNSYHLSLPADIRAVHIVSWVGYINVNKNPTRCNSMQIFIYCKATLHVVPIRPRWTGVAVPVVWPVLEPAVTVFSTPDVGCCDTRNM